MGKHDIAVNRIGAKSAMRIVSDDPAGYNAGTTLTDIGDNDWVTKSMAANIIVPTTQDIIPITSGFSYDTGITDGSIPRMATYLKTSTSLTPYGVPTYDTATGIITSDLYNGVDDYVLVVG